MTRRRVAWLAAAVVVVLLAGAVGDWYLRNRELDRLVGRIQASEDVINPLPQQVEDIFGAYVGRPLSPEERAALYGRIEDAAAGSAVEVRRRVEAVDRLAVLPWHGAIDRARDAYVSHAGVWLDHLAGLAADAEAAYGQRSPLIDSTYEEALALLRKAVPARPLHDVEARIKRLDPT